MALLLMATCGGLLYSGYRTADASISPKIDAMFVAISNDQLSSAYANETTSEFRNAVTEDQLVALGQLINLRLGTLRTKSLRGYKMKQRNADSLIDVTYAAVFEKGKGSITATMKKEGGDWKFIGFRVHSPIFEQDLATQKCPTCNQPHRYEVKDV